MDLLSNIYNFIYIAVIILGGITLTLTLILNAKERDKLHRAVFFFIGAIFVYMIVDFITYYFLSEISSGNVVFALITMSDTLFCLLTTAWVYMLIVMIKIDDVINMRWIVIVSAVYLVSSQILSISLGRYESYVLYVENGIGKLVLQGLNFGYEVYIIVIGLLCIKLLLKRYQKGGARNVNLIMVLFLIVYTIWTVYWDYSTWYETEENLLDVYAVDPLILMYAIFNVAIIYYFYRKDPLKLMDSQIAPEDAVMIVSERYGLSKREKEVLELINCGMSNPQIAGELSISENTVKRHVNNIFRKTETQSRHEIIYKISNVKKI